MNLILNGKKNKMLKPVLYPYKMTSQSAKKLAQSLECKRVFPDRNYRSYNNHLIINWGNSNIPTWWMDPWYRILNHPYHVHIATNKRDTFNQFVRQGISHPEWSDCKDWATTIIEQGHKVFCRISLTSHSGNGIIIAETIDQLVDAPLYVKAVKKDKEYRVHVFLGQIIDFQLKRKKLNFEGGTNGIRNHHNGWIYARSDVQLPETVATESIKAVQALGLDFGAVDVCTDREGKVFVFEVNTAPGLHGTTLQKYTETIRSLL